MNDNSTHKTTKQQYGTQNTHIESTRRGVRSRRARDTPPHRNRTTNYTFFGIIITSYACVAYANRNGYKWSVSFCVCIRSRARWHAHIRKHKQIVSTRRTLGPRAAQTKKHRSIWQSYEHTHTAHSNMYSRHIIDGHCNGEANECWPRVAFVLLVRSDCTSAGLIELRSSFTCD